MMKRALTLVVILSAFAALPRSADAQISVQDLNSYRNQALHYAQMIKQYQLQAMQLEMQIQELKYLGTTMFSRQFHGYYLRNQIFGCPWSRDYTGAMDGTLGQIGGQLAYFNSTLRSLENGCIVDYPAMLKAQSQLRQKLDKSNTHAMESIAMASKDLRQFDQEIGQAIAWAGESDELGRTTTALLQKTTINTMLSAALQRRQLITQDALLEAVATSNHATRDQIVERLNSEYRRNAKWSSILQSLQ
jgi:hypothetical protein